MTETFKVGEIVQARVFITDKGLRDRPYIHAIPGMYGIVIAIKGPGPGSYSEEEGAQGEVAVVDWKPQGVGLYDCGGSQIIKVNP